MPKAPKTPEQPSGLDWEKAIKEQDATLAEHRRKRERPSERLNRTGERLRDRDPVRREINALATSVSAKARRDMLIGPMLVNLALDDLAKTGLEFDEQLSESLHLECQKILATWPPMERLAVAQAMVNDCQYLIRNSQAQDVRHVLLGACRLVLEQVEQGVHPNPDSQAVLVSTAILTEAMEDPDGLWDWRPAVVNHVAEQIRGIARIRGHL